MTKKTTKQTTEQALAKQAAAASVAEMVEQAKALLKSAKEIADENGISIDLEGLYEEVSGNHDVDWCSSNCY